MYSGSSKYPVDDDESEEYNNITISYRKEEEEKATINIIKK